jgi:hypothetical protein
MLVINMWTNIWFLIRLDAAGKAKMGNKEWYFFYQKGRKYPIGQNANWATEAGYPKATG